MEDYNFLISFGVLAVVVLIGGVMMNISHKKKVVEQARSAEKEKKKAELLKSIKKIQWGDQFAIDGGIIDKDHKTLFGLVNEFNESIPSFQSPGEMLSILASIKKYTQTHFQREEKLQEIVDFPFCEDHQKEHEALVEKLNGFIKKVMQTNEDNVIDVAVEIGTFLQEWITGHVIESDLPMKAFVDRMRKKVKSEDAKSKDPKSEDAKGEDAKGEDAKGEDPKSEDPKSEDAKSKGEPA